MQGRDVSGKTGTAQVISLPGGRQAAGRTDRDLRDHGWFVFFAPSDNPEIAGVVFAEHAEHGSNSAPIARHVMETYFNKKDGRPLPKLTMPPVRTEPQRDTPPDPSRRRRQPWRRCTEMLERRLYLHIDWLLLGALTCLCVIGVAMIYSTTR